MKNKNSEQQKQRFRLNEKRIMAHLIPRRIPISFAHIVDNKYCLFRFFFFLSLLRSPSSHRLFYCKRLTFKTKHTKKEQFFTITVVVGLRSFFQWCSCCIFAILFILSFAFQSNLMSLQLLQHTNYNYSGVREKK